MNGICLGGEGKLKKRIKNAQRNRKEIPPQK